MPNFVRTLCITIASGLFSFVPKLYKLFYDLAANHNLFSSETLQTFSRNIYVLISVVMLFAFAVKAIESIINPDLLFDSKKGFTAVIKRSAIALVLIIAVPYGFNLFYQVQDEVMSKSLIEKMILGVNVSNSNGNLAESSGAAQMLGSVALQSVLYPEGDTCTEYEDTNVCSEYSSVINEDVGKLVGMVDNINEKVENSEGNEDFVLTYEWNGLLSVIVGAVLVYMLAIFCLDTALRLIKMAFLELTAPISIIAYIYAGNDTLKKWWKEVLGTAMSLFGRIAALAFMIFVLSKLPEFTANNFGGAIYTNIVNLLIIFATLMFIKEAPSMIDKLFGIKVGGKGGIAGRLGNMAGVGSVAKGAWQTLTKAVPVAAGVAAAGIGAGIGLGAKTLDNALGGKGQEFAANVRNKTASVKNSRAGRTIGAGVDAVKAGVNSKGGFVTSMKAATDSIKNSNVGKERDYQLNKKRTSDLYEAVGLNDVGKLRQADEEHPISKDTFKGAKEGIENYSKELAKTPLSSNTKEALNNKISMDKVSKTLSKIKDTNSNIMSSLDTAAGNAKTAQARNAIENLKSEYGGGKLSLNGLNSRLQELVDQGILSAGVAGGINRDVNKLDHFLSNNDKDLQSAFSNIIGKDGEISNTQINVQTSDAEKRTENAKAVLEHVKSNASDYDKTIIERFEGVSDNLVSEYVRKSGAKKDEESDKYSINNPSSTTSGASTTTTSGTSSSNQNTGSVNSSTVGNNNSSDSVNNGVPSGYTQTNSGIVVPNGTNTSGSNTMNNTGQSSTGYEIPTDGGGYSGEANNSNTNSGSTIVNNTTNNTTTSNDQDLSSFFSNLSNDIKTANRETNNILNDQLKSQQSMLDESKKQSRSLDNINSGVDSIKGSVDELGNKMDSYGTSINRNIADLNKKMDDNDKNE